MVLCHMRKQLLHCRIMSHALLWPQWSRSARLQTYKMCCTPLNALRACSIPMSPGPKIMFKEGSKWVQAWEGFWVSLVIYDVTNGIGKVEQYTHGRWVQLQQLSDLGQQYEMQVGVLSYPSSAG